MYCCVIVMHPFARCTYRLYIQCVCESHNLAAVCTVYCTLTGLVLILIWFYSESEWNVSKKVYLSSLPNKKSICPDSCLRNIVQYMDLLSLKQKENKNWCLGFFLFTASVLLGRINDRALAISAVCTVFTTVRKFGTQKNKEFPWENSFY